MKVTLGEPAELGFHDSLAVQGTGCADPATGAADGLIVGLLDAKPSRLSMVKDPDEFHRDQDDLVSNAVEVNSDGSFAGYLVAHDDTVSGSNSVSFACVRPLQPPEILAQTAGYERVTLRPDLGGITFTPSIARAGDTVQWRVDCGDLGSPGYTNVDFAVLGQDVRTTVSDGPYAKGTIQIPPTVSERRDYPVSATCSTQRIGTHRYPTGVLTVQAD